MGKNVAVFVDVANVFYAAKAAGVDIDYVTLLKSASAGRDLVRAYAYTGLDPENENQRNFHAFLARHGYKVVSKDIRKYGDGKVKANLDIELVVDMMKTARNLDIAIVVSGDGDFAPAIRAVQEQGVRVEVISFRGNTSSDLIDVADVFTEITQIAKVEKGSTRSGRRVAGDEEDLSMTEVPDKQTEGTGRGRGGRTSRGGRGRSADRATEQVRARSAASRGDGSAITVLPGERLSRVASGTAEAAPAVAEADGDGDSEAALGEGPRRRRRRGGRGRGRGRGQEGVVAAEAGETDEGGVGRPLDEADMALLREGARRDRAAREPRVAATGPVAHRAVARDPDDEIDERPARRTPTPFGSVWDSQLGVPSGASSDPARTSGAGETIDDDDFAEPEIPEYLIAERNRQGGQRSGNRGGARGGRSGYAAALDRERFGGGRGTVNRFGGERGGSRSLATGSNVGGGSGRSSAGYGDNRAPARRDERPAPPRGGSGGDPWSEVPPELEAMLRAQVSGRSGPEPTRDSGAESAVPGQGAEAAPVEMPPAESAGGARRGARARAAATEGRRSGATGPDATVATPTSEPEAGPKRRTTRGRASASATGQPSLGDADHAAEAGAEPTKPRSPSRRRAVPAAEAAEAATAAPTPRRRTRSAAADAGSEAAADATPGEAGPAAPARRRRAARVATPDA